MEFKLNDYNRNLSDDQLLNDLKNVAEKLNKDTVTKGEYKTYGKYSPETLAKRFGTWIKCLELVGLTPEKNQINYISNEDLIEDLINVSKKIRKDTVTTGEYKLHGKYDCSTFLNKISSWAKGLELAGLKPTGFKKDISDEDLFIDIEKLWVSLGRQPTTTDVKGGLSKYSLNTFSRRFGSWRKALEAFVFYINQDELEIGNDISESLQNNEIEIKETSIISKHNTKRDINLRLRMKVLFRDNLKCKICGASPATDPRIKLHVDHIIPWAKGGETIENNLQTLCSDCNLGKSDLDIY